MSASHLYATSGALWKASRRQAAEQTGAAVPTASRALWLSTLMLLCLGALLVYSSSAVYAARMYDDAQHFLKLQLVWGALGLAAMLALTYVPTAWFRTHATTLLVLAMVLCVLVLIPGIGHRVGGARRWLSLGVAGFQPSELAKVAVVIALASVLARREEKSGHRRTLLVPVLAAQLPVILILAEPDLGTALVIELIVGAMVFAAGLPLRLLAMSGLAALPVFYHLVVGTPFRLQRLLGYIDPWAYRSTVGYQVTEALISLGSGGVMGVGLGDGKHKLFFLPEAHTDFIFAILGEELGLVGVLVVLAAFAVLVGTGLVIARRATHGFEAHLALGLSLLIGVPAVFNMCVATGLLPTKGLPLPLLSYGGSNLIATLASVGMLLRISLGQRHATASARGGSWT
ncbi:MAG: putative lipid II flippase FtsW [Myxococcota bacterium]